jgi:ribonuclease HII
MEMKQLRQKTRSARLSHERRLRRDGFDIVIGVDEAGRGPLAGPVAAAAAALLDFGVNDEAFRYLLSRVDDSKKLSASKRKKIYDLIIGHSSFAWGYAQVSPRLIDKVNILEASKMAMAAAVKSLVKKLPETPRRVFCLVDGNFTLPLPYPQRAIVAGDSKVFLISAASIIAKVRRDRTMLRLDRKYPAYGFARHKGYPTKEHLAALDRRGMTPAHRKSFLPLRGIAQKSYNKKNKHKNKK